jgi:hypothetical protein
MSNDRFNQLLPELQKKVWNYLYPKKDLENKLINHRSLGTSVNNMFLTMNYCYKCGEPNPISNCKFCNTLIISQCNKCKYVSIYNDICCSGNYYESLI